MFSNFRRWNKRNPGKSVLTAELQIFVDIARVTIEFPFNTLSSRAEVAFANFALDHPGRLVVQMLQTEDSHRTGKIFIALSRRQLSNLGTSDRFHSATADCRVVLCCCGINQWPALLQMYPQIVNRINIATAPETGLVSAATHTFNTPETGLVSDYKRHTTCWFIASQCARNRVGFCSHAHFNTPETGSVFD